MTTSMRIDPDDARYLETLPACANCGQLIHEHIRDSEPPWMCPYDYQPGTVYGFFNGGDPRDFSPDYEMCSPEEIANHKRACEEADRDDAKRRLTCPSGYEVVHETVMHVLRAPFGIGVMSYPLICYEIGLPVPCDTEGQTKLFDTDKEPTP